MNFYQRTVDWAAVKMGDKQPISPRGLRMPSWSGDSLAIHVPEIDPHLVSFELAAWSLPIFVGDVVAVSNQTGEAFKPRGVIGGSILFPVGCATEVVHSVNIEGEEVTTVTVRRTPASILLDEEDHREKAEAFDATLRLQRAGTGSRPRFRAEEDEVESDRFRGLRGLPEITRAQHELGMIEEIQQEQAFIRSLKSPAAKEDPIELTSEESSLLDDILYAAAERDTSEEEQEVLARLINKLVD